MDKTIQELIKFKKNNWFYDKLSISKEIFFNSQCMYLDSAKLIKEHLYISTGHRSLKQVGNNKENYNIQSYNDIEIRVDVREMENCQLDLFVLQFNDMQKVKGQSFLLQNGKNKFDLKRETSAKYIKIAVRIKNIENEEKISFSLCNLILLDYQGEPISIQKTSIPSSRFMQKDDINELIFDKYVQYNFKQNEFDYDMVTHFKKDSDKLVIFYNGAVDVVKTPPPVFQRWSWLEKMPYSSMVIMDPTIYKLMQKNQDNTYIGWYQGDKERFVLENIVDIVKDFAQKLDVSNDDILFYGSSAGGFASLMSAAMIPNSKACVVNPQVDILEYHKKNVTILLKHLEQDLAEAKKDTRLNVVKFYQQKDIYPQIYFKQNTKDKLHFEKHFKLIEGLYKDKQNDIHIELMDDTRGHSAIPLFDEAYSDIEKTFEIFSTIS